MRDLVHQRLPALYLAWALPLVLMLAWLMPPWSNPDEANHMLRVVELAHGELIGRRLGPRGGPAEDSFLGKAGGLSDIGVLGAAAPFDPLRHHPERKVGRSLLLDGDHVPWHGSLSLVGFANTAPYPPFLYLPAVVAVRIAYMIGLRVDHTLYMARGANGLAAVLVNTAALMLARRTRYALAGLAMLPMTCALDASVSQDALMMGLSFLAVGWIDRIIEHGRAAGAKELAVLALVLTLVAMARPPYITLVLLLFLARRPLSWLTVAAACLMVAGVGAWSALAAATVVVSRGNPLVQVSLLAAHPLHLGTVALTTLRDYARSYGRQLIGNLGWLDTPLPHWYYVFAWAVLACGFAAATDAESGYSWLPLLAASGGALLIFAVQYLSWTRPGADFVDGVQGRYFVPLVATLALAVPAFPRMRRLVRPVTRAGLAALGMITPFVIVQALLVRYYLGN